MSPLSSLLLPIPTTSSIEGRRINRSLLRLITNQIGGWKKRGLGARARFPVVLVSGSSTFIFLLFLVDTLRLSRMLTNSTMYLRIDAQALLPVIEGLKMTQTEGVWIMGVIAVLVVLLLLFSFITKRMNTRRGVVWRCWKGVMRIERK